MARAILVRIGQAVVSLFVLLVFTWGLVRVTGDPIYFLLPQDATQQQREFARQQLGLDEPLPAQFFAYIGGVARGDLGISFNRRSLNVPITEMIAQRVPATVTLGLGALFITICVGVPLGILSAYRRGSRLDRVTRFIAALGQAAPSFWVGVLLIVVFAIHLRLLPAGGLRGIDSLILPASVLAFGSTAGLIRLLRSSMIEVLGSDYITFHRIKGLPERTILWKHALRNAGLTTLSYVGIIVANLFTGSVLVESVFTWPGIGHLFVEAVGHRDFNLIQGLVLVFGAAYIASNLLVDVLYTILNPRLR